MTELLEDIIARNVESAAPISFEWDEWNVRSYYMFPPKQSDLNLSSISQSAALALTVASSQWIFWRFRLTVPDPEPAYVVEAAWASILDRTLADYYETKDDDWRGPDRAIVAVAIAIVNDAIYCLDMDPDVSVRTGWIYNLAQHCLPDFAPFDAWFRTCVERLSLLHPASETPSFDGFGFPDLGPPVAREAFDPQVPYDPARAVDLLSRMFQRVNPRNPLLNFRRQA